MALAFRVIPRIDIRNDSVIKTIRCEGTRKVGIPSDIIKRYDDDSADEMAVVDCVASLYDRPALDGVLYDATDSAYCPVTVAGGVRTAADVRRLLMAGADKVAINTAAVRSPGLLTELSTKFGSSTIVLHLDAKRCGDAWQAYTNGARVPSGRDAVEWAKEAVDLGVGEIFATSIDREGTYRGLDLHLVEALAALPVPVVISGGFGKPQDAVAAYNAGAQGVAISGALHYGRCTLNSIKHFLKQSGVPTRICESSLQGLVDSLGHT